MGVVLPEPGFLESVRDLCTQHGSVFIMDEVMTGFRVALGGAQQRFNIMPDICMLGKVIGGGMPVGAYGGKAEIMDAISPVGTIYQAGTLSGNPIAMASGIATLECLREANPYPQLEKKTQRLTKGLIAAATKAGLEHTLAECGSMFTLFFNPEKVTSYAISARNDTARFARYFQGMLDRGVYLPCSQFEANFTSTMLTEEDIVHTIHAAEEVLQEIA
jgi:glutamate-1-semialdehyde 2,1-aminomutase